jgi:hypothetical protein
LAEISRWYNIKDPIVKPNKTGIDRNFDISSDEVIVKVRLDYKWVGNISGKSTYTRQYFTNISIQNPIRDSIEAIPTLSQIRIFSKHVSSGRD